ncbi:hypothetical protein [Candidatus Endomicrobiellum agilis]|uniref:hypothetical protein n=1 Tax=Candidatus Endomicrobiellum agilis TaxID=3238957 RepID=UPI003582D11E|nr:hypothetical protein [Endomicrobium sp.]
MNPEDEEKHITDSARNILETIHARFWEKKLVPPQTAVVGLRDAINAMESVEEKNTDLIPHEAKKIITKMTAGILITKEIKSSTTKPEDKEYFKKILAKFFDKELKAILEKEIKSSATVRR